MSESVTKNSGDTETSLKSGEEPTELLLALVYSPIETLLARGLVEIYVNPTTDKVAVIFHKTMLEEGKGFVPVANTVKKGANTDGNLA